jgi:hypothetical protein
MTTPHHPSPHDSAPRDDRLLSKDTTPVVARFPTPPPGIRGAMDVLQIAAAASMTNEEVLCRVEGLPRPWDPATCPGDMRAELWAWLDEVAAWINTEHLWSLQTPGVPACWPAHPHIAHDLAVVASSRYLTMYAVSPAALEEWHRYALPAFLHRLTDRLGEGCVAGHQQPRPRAARDQDFADSTQAGRRRARFDVDSDLAGRHVTPKGSR